MGLFDYTSNFGFGTPAALGGSMFNSQDLYKIPAPNTSAPTVGTGYKPPPKPTTSIGSDAGPTGVPTAGLSLWGSGYKPPAAKPPAPPPTQTAPTYSSSGGGGGGSYTGPTFNNTYSYSNVGPQLTPMPSMDFGGLLEGFGNLLSKDQQGDVGQPTMPVQKDTMALQALRESAAGWQDNVTGPTANQALGQRIPPDESKKLAALQTARIY